MSDFSELEAELKKLRPRAASPGLAMRIERALAEAPVATPSAGILPKDSYCRGVAQAAKLPGELVRTWARTRCRRDFSATGPGQCRAAGQEAKCGCDDAGAFRAADSRERYICADRYDTGCLQYTRRGIAFSRGRSPTGPPRPLADARDLAVAQSRDRHVAACFVSE